MPASLARVDAILHVERAEPHTNSAIRMETILLIDFLLLKIFAPESTNGRVNRALSLAFVLFADDSLICFFNKSFRITERTDYTTIGAQQTDYYSTMVKHFKPFLKVRTNCWKDSTPSPNK